jgi:signal transduction histidine kinase
VKTASLFWRQLAAPLASLVILAPWQVLAQTAETLPPVLTNLAQVRALGPVRAQELKHPVHVRGVVTYMNSQRTHFFLQDATAAMMVPVMDTNLCPGFEMDVEVKGITGNYGARWGIVQGQFTVHGAGGLPPPIKATLAEVQALRHSSQWVEVEGVVLAARPFRSQYLVLQLGDASGTAPISLPAYSDQLSPTNVIGARVRVQGLNVRAEQALLLAQDAKLVSLITPGGDSTFSAPSATVSSLRSAGPSLDRVSLRGTVLRTIYKPSPGHGIYIRDDTGALRTVLLERQSTNDANYVDARPGDRVELVGSATAIQPTLFLQYGQMRFLQGGPEPEPIAATPAEIAAGKFTSDFVSVRGRLLARNEMSSGNNRWRDVLRLSAQGREVEVFLDSESSGKFASLSLDDAIEARGLVVPEAGARPGASAKRYLVQVVSAAEVHSLGLAPEIARLRTVQLVGGATGLTLLAGSWIALLRSRLAREQRVAIERERSEAAIREANTSLERRVAQRTAELENAREEIARALQAERDLNALKTRFISIVSHEFRTPLGIIMSAVELLRNYQDRLPSAKCNELHADIYSSTRQMAGLMEQVLVLGRVEGGKIECTPKPVDLAACCTKLADESLAVSGHRCPINVCADGALAGGQVDEALMRHLFGNLLSNAVKYSPAGRSVEFAVRRAGKHAVFTVRDHGIGIPEADLPHLCEPFRRASNVGETPGTGLGLLIVKRCVELQGGQVEIQSQVGKGTTITVTLPAFAADSVTP